MAKVIYSRVNLNNCENMYKSSFIKSFMLSGIFQMAYNDYRYVYVVQ
jgi:hypothetical protein